VHDSLTFKEFFRRQSDLLRACPAGNDARFTFTSLKVTTRFCFSTCVLAELQMTLEGLPFRLGRRNGDGSTRFQRAAVPFSNSGW
jgi:hypothetical protein